MLLQFCCCWFQILRQLFLQEKFLCFQKLLYQKIFLFLYQLMWQIFLPGTHSVMWQWTTSWLHSGGLSSDVFIGTRCPWGPIYGSAPNVSQSVHPTLCAHFKTDLTLTDEDTNSTVTDFRILSVKWRYHPPLQTKILSKKSYRLKGYTPTPLYWHIPGNFSQKRTKYCVCFLAFKNTCLWKKFAK